MTVSVALIVKNEERTLARCLRSIEGAVDELIVVDTGSTDATKAVAAGFGARVFDFAWCDDFADARQYAFSLATREWVFWLDADDVVLGADRIRHMTAGAPPEVKGFYWRYVLRRSANGAPTFTYWRERCVRNDGSARWVGRAHEVLVLSQPASLVRTDEIVVEHHPDPDRNGRPARNLRILEDECSKGVPEPRALFYLGREYAEHGDVRRAIETLQRYRQVSRWDDERYLAEVQIADLLCAQGRYDEGAGAYFAALRTHPSWPDAYFGLAATSYFQQDWQQVVDWVDVARSRPRPDTLLFVNTLTYEFSWIIYYTNALFRLGRLDEALEWTRTALSIVPDDPWHVHNLTFFTRELAARSPGAPAARAEGPSPPTTTG